MELSLLDNAHFIRPWWLIALPGAALIWYLLRNQTAGQQWASHIARPMLEALQVNIGHSNSHWRSYLIAFWVIVTIAAAGPSWNKQATPTFENKNARVLVLDLSPSMLAQDLEPNRLTLAKYKLIDILREQGDGQAALIAYAGDAHTVSPLTDDPSNIEALLPALHPDVMPISGSNTESAIALAQDLLENAGVSRGDIILISDGVAKDAITTIKQNLKRGYKLSVLAVGGTEPTPIPGPSGGFLKKKNGEIAVAQLELNELRSFTSSTGGNFARLSRDDSDLKQLLKRQIEDELNNDNQASEQRYDAWVDMGHWLILLALPIALFLFRKGVIYLIPLCMIIGLADAPEAIAQSSENSSDRTPNPKSNGQSFWLTKDQQASHEFNNGDYESAAKRFENLSWAGVSHYKSGDYRAALESLSDATNIQDLYNKANALAFDGQFKEAVETYQKVLDIDAEHKDAAHNKSVIEELLKQQEQQAKNSEQQKSDQQNQDQNTEQENSDQQNSDQSESDSQSQKDDQQQSEGAEQEQTNSKTQNQDADQKSEENSSEQEVEQSKASEKSKEEEIADKPSQNAKPEETVEDSEDTLDSNGQANAINTKEPLEDSSEQWLRSIQDDPSGLLRRKFEYQSKLRSQQRALPRAQQGRAADTNSTERY